MCKVFNLCSSPSYSFNKNEINHWIDHKIYGVWHKENTEFIHVSECFSAKYLFNSFGAKDPERELNGKNRTLIVGDSYIEGYGVDNHKNFSYLMERESYSNTKYLNFSSSGYFGSTQYYVLIKDLLKKIEFDRVILFLNPGSDFKDDSYEFGKLFHYKKYRPYLDQNLDQIFYYNEEYKNYQNDEIKFKNILDNFTYSYKFLRYLKQQFISSLKNKKIKELNNKDTDGYVSYYEKYPNDTFNILKKNLFNIHQILDQKKIKLVVFTIPSKKDLLYFESNKNAYNNLDIDLENYLNKLGIKFSSLLESKVTNKKLEIKNYFDCTDHLSEDGHISLKDIIKDRLISLDEKY